MLQAYKVEGIFYSSSALSTQILISFLSLFTKGICPYLQEVLCVEEQFLMHIQGTP